MGSFSLEHVSASLLLWNEHEFRNVGTRGVTRTLGAALYEHSGCREH